MKKFDLAENFRLLGKRFRIYGVGLQMIIKEIHATRRFIVRYATH